MIQSGIIEKGGVVLKLGNFHQKEVLLAIFGLFVIGILTGKKVKGSILIGMVITAVIGIFTGVIKYQGIVGKIPSLSPTFLKLDIIGALKSGLFTVVFVFLTFLKLDIIGALKSGLFTVVFVFLFMDIFDTIGTAIGIGEAAGFMKNGKFPGAHRILFSDAVGTTVGAILGTSTVTSYIESATGVSAGGKTGFTSIITAFLFLLALFFYPFVKMIGTGITLKSGITLYPVTSPALIVVGSLMIPLIKKVKWEDPTEGIPAFLSFVGIPFTYNIGEGMAFGFISYFIFKLFTGKYKDLNWVVIIVAIAFILRFAFIK